MDGLQKLAQVTEAIKERVAAKQPNKELNRLSHDNIKAQMLDGGTPTGMRLFNLRICRRCKHVEVSGGTYERDETIPLVKGVTLGQKDEGCSGSREAMQEVPQAN